MFNVCDSCGLILNVTCEEDTAQQQCECVDYTEDTMLELDFDSDIPMKRFIDDEYNNVVFE